MTKTPDHMNLVFVNIVVCLVYNRQTRTHADIRLTQYFIETKRTTAERLNEYEKKDEKRKVVVVIMFKLMLATMFH